MNTYRYQWSKKYDAAHTITLNGVKSDEAARYAASCWVRDLRAGCPWRIVCGERIVEQGVGPASVLV